MKRLIIILAVMMLAGQVFAWDLFGGLKDLVGRLQYTGFHLAGQTRYTGQCLFNGLNFMAHNPNPMVWVPRIQRGSLEYGMNMSFSTAGWFHTMLNWPPEPIRLK